MKRKIIGGLLLLGLVSATTYWLFYRASEQPESGRASARRGQQPVAVELAPVQVQAIRDLRSLSGSLKANTEFDVAAKIGGRVEAVNVQLGDEVRRGQVVARLDDDEYVVQREQARAELSVAQASLEEAKSALALAETEFRRISDLRSQGIAPQAELEKARADRAAAQARLKLAQAQVAQRQAALKAAEVRLDYTVVRAGWQEGGDTRVVGQRFVDPGATLAANARVVSVLDLDPVVAVVTVTERDYVRLRPGQQAVVTTAAYPERRFQAEVARVAPRLDEASRQARVELTVRNEDRLLRPGMFVTVDIVLEHIAEATVVPQVALVERDGRTGVFLTDAAAAQVRFVPVRTGVAEGGRVQILEPALQGRVVTLGQHLLRDGARIRAVEPDRAVATDSGRDRR